MISLAASSIDMSRMIASSSGTKNRKPVVGFGVVGMKTEIILRSPSFCATSPLASVDTKATAQSPLRGYSTRQALLNEFEDCENTVSAICFKPL